MKTWRKLSMTAACGLVVASAVGTKPALAQVKDDFNDGNDTGWSHFDLGALGLNGAQYTFPADGAGGKAYHVYAPAPLVDAGAPALAITYRATPQYTRFQIAVDVLNWATDINQALGIFGRATDIGFPTIDGYVMNYNVADGDLQINEITDLGDQNTRAELHFPMTPQSGPYRWVFSGYENNFLGQVYKLPDTANPIASVVGLGVIGYPSGSGGVFVFNRDGSPHDTATKVGDATFDNYESSAPAAGSLGAVAFELSPSPGSSVRTALPQIRFAVLDRETTVNPGSFQMAIDGAAIPAASITIATEVVVPNNTEPFAGATASYTPAAPLSAGSHTVRASFADSGGQRHTNEWTFTAAFLDTPAGTGKDRGFNVRVVQGTQETTLGNSLARAEAQLSPNSPYPEQYDTNVTASLINYSQSAITGGTDGTFPDDAIIPGQTEEGGTDNWAMEVLTWLDLPAGVVTLGVQSDDGYRVSSDALPGANKVISERDGGTANQTFDIYVAKAGLYPFRLLWYENGGGAHLEWFSVNASAERVLLNADGGIKAYRTLNAPAGPTVQSSATVNGQYLADASAVVDATNKRITIPLAGAAAKFYRLSATSQTHISTVKIQGSDLVMTYE